MARIVGESEDEGLEVGKSVTKVDDGQSLRVHELRRAQKSAPSPAISMSSTHLLNILVEQEDSVVESIAIHSLRIQRKRPRPSHHADEVHHSAPAPEALDGIVDRYTEIGSEG